MQIHPTSNIIVLLLLFSSIFYSESQYIEPLYAEWAHEHVVWINSAQQNQTEIVKLVEDYQKRNIRIGGVNIDSAWSTGFNNFQWNLKKFPEPQKLIDWLHGMNIKVILWVTSVINQECSLFEQGLKNGYFLSGGKLVQWWHGKGAFLDYFNPKAVQWWHKQMDKVLDMGVDGFKCDGTDPMITLIRPWPYSSGKKRYIAYHEYANMYYGDFYNYTKSKNPNALIMARPTDSYAYNGVRVYINYAPKYMMFSGWVGDQDSTFYGMKQAMLDVIHSAWNGYLSYGFDIGGYRNKAHNPHVFLRWFQLGAFVPFMENGGGGIHRPWQYSQNMVDIYKKFVDIHYDIKPTLLTYGALAFANKVSMIEPLAKRQSYTIAFSDPKTFGYLLCQQFLVFPIFSENGITEVIFPSGSNWVYYFDHKKVFKNGTKANLMFPEEESPVFMKDNSLIAFQSALHVVGLEQGTYNETIMHSTYTDRIHIDYKASDFKIKVDRSYKNTESSQSEDYLTLRFILHEISDQGLNRIEVKRNEQDIDVKIKVNREWSTLRALKKKSVSYEMSEE